MKAIFFSLKINLGLLFSGFAMVFSGLLIQINYHMGNHGGIDINKAVWGLSHTEWSMTHEISDIIFSFLMVCHIIMHWQWFNAVITKNLIAKNKQVISLSIIFFLVALTGYIPWLIKLTGGETPLSKVFVEIHDKIALIFVVYLVLHISNRVRWFIITFDKLKQ